MRWHSSSLWIVRKYFNIVNKNIFATNKYQSVAIKSTFSQAVGMKIIEEKILSKSKGLWGTALNGIEYI